MLLNEVYTCLESCFGQVVSLSVKYSFSLLHVILSRRKVVVGRNMLDSTKCISAIYMIFLNQPSDKCQYLGTFTSAPLFCVKVSHVYQANNNVLYFLHFIPYEFTQCITIHIPGKIISLFIQIFLYRDIQKMQDGMGEKFGTLIQMSMTFIVAFVQSFVIGWKLALVMLVVLPVLIISALIASTVRYLYLVNNDNMGV